MRVGITGGIGSGKSSVSRMFSTLGIPVFDADEEGRRITDSNQAVLQRLSEIAGENLMLSGQLDRKLLASLIFNDEEKLGQVNRLIHPLVFEAFENWAAGRQAPYVIMEAAILFESGADKLVDKVIAVTAPLEERIARVSARSGLSRDEVLERARHQLKEEELVGLSHYIISNSDNEMVIPRILDLHRELLQQSLKHPG